MSHVSRIPRGQKRISQLTIGDLKRAIDRLGRIGSGFIRIISGARVRMNYPVTFTHVNRTMPSRDRLAAELALTRISERDFLAHHVSISRKIIPLMKPSFWKFTQANKGLY